MRLAWIVHPDARFQPFKNRTGRPVRLLRFEETDEVEAFDNIWVPASLHHVHSADWPGVMRRVA